MLDKYGCLLLPGEITVPIVIPWTKESVPGNLKRQGKIVTWELDKTYEEGNDRRFLPWMQRDKI